MSISSYNDLLLAVANWMGRDDLAPRIPEFIVLAEAKFNRSLKCRQMEKRSYATVDSTTQEPQYISLPNDFQTMRSVCLSGVSGKPRLEYLPDEQIKDYRSNIGDTTGTPRYFGVFGTEVELVPAPDQNYVLEMIYRATVPALSVNATSNWLLILAPDAYLYGALMEASIFMKNDARIQTWLVGLKSAIDAINGLASEVVINNGNV